MAALLNPLVGLISALVALEAIMMLRWRVRDDLPMGIMLFSIAGIGFGTMILAPESLIWPAIPLVYGVLIQPLGFVLGLWATIARVRGAFRLAWWLHLPLLLMRPGHRTRVAMTVLGALKRWQAGRVTREAAIETLRDELERLRRIVRPHNRNYLTTSGLLLRAAKVEILAREGDWAALADEVAPETLHSIGVPCQTDAAWTVRALCEMGRLDEAYGLLGLMTGGVELRSPTQMERFASLERGRVTWLAFAGQREAVDSALAWGSQIRPIFTAAERTVLLEIAARPCSHELDQETIEVVAAAVRQAERLPSAFSTVLSPAPVTLALVVANIAIYLPITFSGSPYDPLHLLHVGGLQATLVAHGELWRLMTSMFIHAGALHLVLNTALLFALGSEAERLLGRAPFAFIYLASGLGGGVAAALGSGQAVVVGASGAVFGVIGALTMAVFLMRREVPRQWYRRRISAYLFLLVANSWMGWELKFVSFSAHTGGLVVGALLALAMVLLGRRFPARLARLAAWACAALWLGLAGWSGVMDVLSLDRPALDLMPRRVERFESQGPDGTTGWEIEVPGFWISPDGLFDDDEQAPLLMGGNGMLLEGEARCVPQLAFSAVPPTDELSGFSLSQRVLDEEDTLLVEARRTSPEGRRLRLVFLFQGREMAPHQAMLQELLRGVRVVDCPSAVGNRQ